MVYQFRILSLVLLALSATNVQAIYKCTVNGKTVYSDLPCGDNQEKIYIKGNQNSKGENTKAEDYYSPENQLKRINDDKKKAYIKESEEKLKASEKEIRDIQSANYDKDKCLIAQMGAANIKSRDPLYKINIDWFQFKQQTKLYCFE